MAEKLNNRDGITRKVQYLKNIALPAMNDLLVRSNLPPDEMARKLSNLNAIVHKISDEIDSLLGISRTDVTREAADPAKMTPLKNLPTIVVVTEKQQRQAKLIESLLPKTSDKH